MIHILNVKHVQNTSNECSSEDGFGNVLRLANLAVLCARLCQAVLLSQVAGTSCLIVCHTLAHIFTSDAHQGWPNLALICGCIPLYVRWVLYAEGPILTEFSFCIPTLRFTRSKGYHFSFVCCAQNINCLVNHLVHLNVACDEFNHCITVKCQFTLACLRQSPKLHHCTLDVLVAWSLHQSGNLSPQCNRVSICT